ncbi:MAG TPA: hypothetical protein VFC58_07955 [Desulfosporosinus sp.]|nr:hypothetical protein [Desulfosporosinus sp.]
MDNNTTGTDIFRESGRRFYFALPLFLLVPVGFWLAQNRYGVTMNWYAFGLGALGWSIALGLRGPISLVCKFMSKEKTTTIIVASSGPLEEIVRLLLLALTSAAFSWSVSVGQGWAAMEVLFAIINSIVLTIMVQRTDEKAMQAREFLESSGNLNMSPIWGVVERIFASAFHIGSTILIASNFWFVIIMIPIHSVINLGALKLAKKSIVLTEVLIAVVGTLVFLTSLLASKG